MNSLKKKLVVEEEDSSKKLVLKFLIGLSTSHIFDKWTKNIVEEDQNLKEIVKESINLKSLLEIHCYREFRNKWKIFVIPFTKMDCCFKSMILFENLEEISQNALHFLKKRKGQLSVFSNIGKNSSGNECYYKNFIHDEYVNYQILEKGFGFLLFMNSLEDIYGIDKLKEILKKISSIINEDDVIVFDLCKNLLKEKNDNFLCLQFLLKFIN